MECMSFLLGCVAWEWVALLYLDLCSKRFNFLKFIQVLCAPVWVYPQPALHGGYGAAAAAAAGALVQIGYAT